MNIRATVTDYLTFCKTSGKSEDTVKSYAATLDKLADHLTANGITDIECVTPSALVGFKAAQSAKVSATSLRLYLTHINGFCSFCAEMEYIAKSPYKKSLMTVERSAIREQTAHEYQNILTPDDFRVIVSCKHPHNTWKREIARNKALLMMFLTTGLRNESVRELVCSDIEWENRRIKVTAAKGGKSGYAPLTDLCACALREYIAPLNLASYEPLFGKTDENGQRTAYPRTQMSNIVECAVQSYLPGKHGFRTHSLRHSFASILANSGMSEAEISRLLFHSDKSGAAVTARYINRDDSELFAKVNDTFNHIAQSVLA